MLCVQAAQTEMLGHAGHTSSAARDAGTCWAYKQRSQRCWDNQATISKDFETLSAYLTDNMCACLPTNIAWLHNTHTHTHTHTHTPQLRLHTKTLTHTHTHTHTHTDFETSSTQRHTYTSTQKHTHTHTHIRAVSKMTHRTRHSCDS